MTATTSASGILSSRAGPILLTVAAIGLAVWTGVACSEAGTPPSYTVEEVRVRLQQRGFTVDSTTPLEVVERMAAEEGYRWFVRGQPVEIYRFAPGSRASRRSLEGARRRGIKRQPTLTVGNIAVVIGEHPDSAGLRRALLDEEER